MPLLMALCTVAGILIGTFYTNHFAGNRLNIINSESNRLNNLLHIVNDQYVDSVDPNDIVEKAIPQILSELDPHSIYISAKDVEIMNDDLKGSFCGIGIEFTIREDTIHVQNVISDGPSERAGIVAGDKIVEIDGKPFVGKQVTNTEAMRRLKGEKGTKVNVGIIRFGSKEIKHFTLIRDEIATKSIESVYMLNETTGYIKVKKFAENTYPELLIALATLSQENFQNLVIDLRGNTGGYMQTAVQMANEFLPANRLITYVEGRRSPRNDFTSDGRGAYQKMPLIVLIDEASASSSEIFAGAIQDNDRGTIIGRRSFGKGLVQQQISFHDGSMIRLTVARYYTPSGRCIQKPYKPGDKAGYDMDFEQRLKHGELTCRDSIHFADSLKFNTLKKQRTVYGGGGIMPDVFVPLDTTQYTRYHRMLVAKGIIVAQTLKYFDLHRKEMAKYNDIKHFCSDFIVPDELIKIVMKEGEKQDIKPKDEEERKRTMPYLKMQLKALMARDLFNQSAYLEVANPYSDIYNKGVEVMKVLIKENKYDKVQ